LLFPLIVFTQLTRQPALLKWSFRHSRCENCFWGAFITPLTPQPQQLNSNWHENRQTTLGPVILLSEIKSGKLSLIGKRATRNWWR